jgi:hypothetical protein
MCCLFAFLELLPLTRSSEATLLLGCRRLCPLRLGIVLEILFYVILALVHIALSVLHLYMLNVSALSNWAPINTLSSETALGFVRSMRRRNLFSYQIGMFGIRHYFVVALDRAL